MGKNLIQQKRGKGSLTYRAPSFRYKAEVKHYNLESKGVITDLVHCAGHSAPLMEVFYTTGDKHLTIAPDGVKVGDEVKVGICESLTLNNGNVLALKNIPDGTLIHNIELRPGDGGKLVRTSGSFAKIVAKLEGSVKVKLPSNQEKLFSQECKAAIGVIAGSGRLEKPFLKAGVRYKKMRARNKLYPIVCGISMNAVNHPFGGKCSHIKGRPTQCARSAPPGRKAGKIAPRRTGRKNR